MRYVKKIKPFFVDERGEMSHLLDKETVITSALLITCKKGSIRANHYHKKDTHYSYMLSGSMEYTYVNLKVKNKRKKKILVKKGELILTPPMTAHAMRFLEPATFLALTTEKRDRKQYEHDTVRLDVI